MDEDIVSNELITKSIKMKWISDSMDKIVPQ